MVFKAIDETVVLDRAAVVEYRGVVHLANGQLRDIVGRYIAHELDCLWPRDDELPHVRDVEQPASLAHCLVLGRDSGRVLDRHLVAGEGDDLGAEGAMYVVEGRALERPEGCRVGHALGSRSGRY